MNVRNFHRGQNLLNLGQQGQPQWNFLPLDQHLLGPGINPGQKGMRPSVRAGTDRSRDQKRRPDQFEQVPTPILYPVQRPIQEIHHPVTYVPDPIMTPAQDLQVNHSTEWTAIPERSETMADALTTPEVAQDVSAEVMASPKQKSWLETINDTLLKIVIGTMIPAVARAERIDEYQYLWENFYISRAMYADLMYYFPVQTTLGSALLVGVMTTGIVLSARIGKALWTGEKKTYESAVMNFARNRGWINKKPDAEDDDKGHTGGPTELDLDQPPPFDMPTTRTLIQQTDGSDTLVAHFDEIRHRVASSISSGWGMLPLLTNALGIGSSDTQPTRDHEPGFGPLTETTTGFTGDLPPSSVETTGLTIVPLTELSDIEQPYTELIAKLARSYHAYAASLTSGSVDGNVIPFSNWQMHADITIALGKINTEWLPILANASSLNLNQRLTALDQLEESLNQLQALTTTTDADDEGEGQEQPDEQIILDLLAKIQSDKESIKVHANEVIPASHSDVTNIITDLKQTLGTTVVPYNRPFLKKLAIVQKNLATLIDDGAPQTSDNTSPLIHELNAAMKLFAQFIVHTIQDQALKEPLEILWGRAYALMSNLRRGIDLVPLGEAATLDLTEITDFGQTPDTENIVEAQVDLSSATRDLNRGDKTLVGPAYDALRDAITLVAGGDTFGSPRDAMTKIGRKVAITVSNQDAKHIHAHEEDDQRIDFLPGSPFQHHQLKIFIGWEEMKLKGGATFSISRMLEGMEAVAYRVDEAGVHHLSFVYPDNVEIILSAHPKKPEAVAYSIKLGRNFPLTIRRNSDDFAVKAQDILSKCSTSLLAKHQQSAESRGWVPMRLIHDIGFPAIDFQDEITHFNTETGTFKHNDGSEILITQQSLGDTVEVVYALNEPREIQKRATRAHELSLHYSDGSEIRILADKDNHDVLYTQYHVGAFLAESTEPKDAKSLYAVPADALPNLFHPPFLGFVTEMSNAEGRLTFYDPDATDQTAAVPFNQHGNLEFVGFTPSTYQAGDGSVFQQVRASLEKDGGVLCYVELQANVLGNEYTVTYGAFGVPDSATTFSDIKQEQVPEKLEEALQHLSDTSYDRFPGVTALEKSAKELSEAYEDDKHPDGLTASVATPILLEITKMQEHQIPGLESQFDIQADPDATARVDAAKAQLTTVYEQIEALIIKGHEVSLKSIEEKATDGLAAFKAATPAKEKIPDRIQRINGLAETPDALDQELKTCIGSIEKDDKPNLDTNITATTTAVDQYSNFVLAPMKSVINKADKAVKKADKATKAAGFDENVPEKFIDNLDKAVEPITDLNKQLNSLHQMTTTRAALKDEIVQILITYAALRKHVEGAVERAKALAEAKAKTKQELQDAQGVIDGLIKDVKEELPKSDDKAGFLKAYQGKADIHASTIGLLLTSASTTYPGEFTTEINKLKKDIKALKDLIAKNITQILTGVKQSFEEAQSEYDALLGTADISNYDEQVPEGIFGRLEKLKEKLDNQLTSKAIFPDDENLEENITALISNVSTLTQTYRDIDAKLKEQAAQAAQAAELEAQRTKRKAQLEKAQGDIDKLREDYDKGILEEDKIVGFLANFERRINAHDKRIDKIIKEVSESLPGEFTDEIKKLKDAKDELKKLYDDKIAEIMTGIRDVVAEAKDEHTELSELYKNNDFEDQVPEDVLERVRTAETNMNEVSKLRPIYTSDRDLAVEIGTVHGNVSGLLEKYEALDKKLKEQAAARAQAEATAKAQAEAEAAAQAQAEAEAAAQAQAEAEAAAQAQAEAEASAQAQAEADAKAAAAATASAEQIDGEATGEFDIEDLAEIARQAAAGDLDVEHLDEEAAAVPEPVEEEVEPEARPKRKVDSLTLKLKFGKIRHRLLNDDNKGPIDLAQAKRLIKELDELEALFQHPDNQGLNLDFTQDSFVAVREALQPVLDGVVDQIDYSAPEPADEEAKDDQRRAPKPPARPSGTPAGQARVKSGKPKGPKRARKSSTSTTGSMDFTELKRRLADQMDTPDNDIDEPDEAQVEPIDDQAVTGVPTPIVNLGGPQAAERLHQGPHKQIIDQGHYVYRSGSKEYRYDLDLQDGPTSRFISGLFPGFSPNGRNYPSYVDGRGKLEAAYQTIYDMLAGKKQAPSGFVVENEYHALFLLQVAGQYLGMNVDTRELDLQTSPRPILTLGRSNKPTHFLDISLDRQQDKGRVAVRGVGKRSFNEPTPGSTVEYVASEPKAVAAYHAWSKFNRQCNELLQQRRASMSDKTNDDVLEWIEPNLPKYRGFEVSFGDEPSDEIDQKANKERTIARNIGQLEQTEAKLLRLRDDIWPKIVSAHQRLQEGSFDRKAAVTYRRELQKQQWGILLNEVGTGYQIHALAEMRRIIDDRF